MKRKLFCATLGIASLVTVIESASTPARAEFRYFNNIRTGVVVPAPCAPGKTEEEINEYRRNGHAGQRACKEVLPQMQKLVEAQVRKYSEEYYKGCSYDPTVPPSSDRKCQGIELQGTVCNMLEHPAIPKTFNGVREFETNHLGRFCGQFTYFKTRLSGRTCSVTPIEDGVYHERERSFNRGAYVHALNCKHKRVNGDIEKGALRTTALISNVQSGALVPGPCAKLAEDYMNKNKESGAYFTSQMGTRINIKDIENCTGTETTKVDELNPDVGARRQSACQLASLRANLESMWANLAACEVFYQAQLSHEQFMGLTNSQTQIDNSIRSIINARRFGSKNARDCNNGPIFKNTYLPVYTEQFVGRANQVWNEETCQ